MSIADVTETAILKLAYQAVAWANYADNAAGTPQTNVGVALHTADPGETGNSSTSEVTYTGYLRVNVARTTGGWSVTGGSCSPVAIISYAAGTGGSGVVTHFSTSKSNAAPPTGAQDILWSGTVTPNINTGNGVTPQLTVSSTITLD